MDHWYIGAALYIVFVIVPYALEQFAYTRYIPRPAENKQKQASSTYGWEYVWDIANFILLIHAGYKMIFRTASLDVWDAVGVAIFIFGVAMRVFALRALSDYYDPGVGVRTDHQVVSGGPYRLLRHPLHIGTNSEIIGLALLAPWWLAIPAVIPGLIYTVYRNRLEEKILSEHLGAAYRDYYQQTWDVVDLLFWKSHS